MFYKMRAIDFYCRKQRRKGEAMVHLNISDFVFQIVYHLDLIRPNTRI